MSDFSTNVGLNSAANKQYAITQQQKQKNVQQEYEGVKGQKGSVANEQIVDMANPNIDEYVAALGAQDEASKTKKKYQPTVESLKEKLARSLESKYDNAHNMLAEAFYGFQVGTASSLLGMLGADPSELESIRRKALDDAKNKLQAGYERLSYAYAEFEIYAS